MKLRSPFLGGLSVVLALFASPAEGALVLLDQIGNPATYQTSQSQAPSGSQIFESEFSSYNSMAIDDFVATPGMTVTSVTGLFSCQAGIAAFDEVEAWQVSIFSSATLAGISIHGDVADMLVMPDLGAVLTVVNTAGIAMITLEINTMIEMAGIYWVGISPVASSSVAGLFFLQNEGAQGAATPASSNGKFANPGQGHEQGTLQGTALDYAYRVEAIPEPSHALLLLAGAGLIGVRRRRAGASPPGAT